jgi:hypothetical protein
LKKGEREEHPGNNKGKPQSEKAVEIAKKALDIASYKLYYVNYKIGHDHTFHSPSQTKDLTLESARSAPPGPLPHVAP